MGKDQKVIRSFSPELSAKDLELLRAGDIAVYERLYLQWRQPILGFVRSLTRSQQEAEDITQDVFIKVWENREKINPKSNISSFLYIMARQSAIKHFYHQKAKDNYVNSADINDVYCYSTENVVIANELELFRKLVLSRMPELRQQIYTMSNDEGLSNEQIAERLNISIRTVYNNLHLTRKELRETLIAIAFFVVMNKIF